ncbi:MAG: tetratricopeptide repeat protein, partial [Acidobacteria bacterium]|nr:tetratricopeptide repeat protein [Acidobacteriota bacterium]
RYTENVEAYQAYLKGRYFWNTRTRVGFAKSRAYFEEAIARDPDFALAYAGLADYYGVGPWFFDIPQREAAEKARAAALKALEIDPTLPEAYITLSGIYFEADWDWAKGMEAIERAIELVPNSAEAHHKRAYRLIVLGRGDEAVAEIERALELDPLNVTLNVDRGEILSYARRYDEAESALRHAIELDPGRSNAHWDLAQVYEQKGMYDAAVEEHLAASALNGMGREALSSLRGAYDAAGMKGFWRKMFELNTTPPGGKDEPPYILARFYAQIGEADQAFRWLDKAYEERSQFMVNLKVEPAFDPLRSDPRYAELLRRVRMP